MEDILREDVPILSRGPDGMPRRGTQQVSTRVPGAQLSSLADFFTAIGASPEAAQRQAQNRLVNIQTAQDRQRGLAIEGSRVTNEELSMIREAEREKRMGMTDLAQILAQTEAGGTVDFGGQSLQIPGIQRKMEIAESSPEAQYRKAQLALQEAREARAAAKDEESAARADRDFKLKEADFEFQQRKFAAQMAVEREKIAATSEAKLSAKKEADEARLAAFNANLDRLATSANQLLEHPGLTKATGFGGTALSKIPGTDAADFAATLHTLRSQVGFNTLQEMRNNSKTGGALGQVSDKENELLQNNLAPLAQEQTTEQMQKSLRDIIAYVEGAKERARAAVMGGTPPPSGVSVTPNIAAILSNVGPGIHTLSDGSKWRKDESGKVTRVE